MATRVDFSPAAEADLIDIALYIAQDNPARAATFTEALQAACLKLGDGPGIGRARPELGDGIRMLPSGNYLVFYRVQRVSVRIERILHRARDIDSLFRGDEATK